MGYSDAKFGPFAGQMLIGDQTQSNLLRVVVQKVGDVEEGSVMPFFEGLESGVMRPVFLTDGSLLLGQTGRGWQAKGGKVASLQHVRWDGKTVAPDIVAHADDGGRVPRRSRAAAGNGVSEKPAVGVDVRVLDVSRCAGLRLARAGPLMKMRSRITIADRQSVAMNSCPWSRSRCIRCRPRASIT